MCVGGVLYNLQLQRVERRAQVVAMYSRLYMLRRVGPRPLCTVCVGAVLYNLQLQRIERSVGAVALQPRQQFFYV